MTSSRASSRVNPDDEQAQAGDRLARAMRRAEASQHRGGQVPPQGGTPPPPLPSGNTPPPPGSSPPPGELPTLPRPNSPSDDDPIIVGGNNLQAPGPQAPLLTPTPADPDGTRGFRRVPTAIDDRLQAALDGQASTNRMLALMQSQIETLVQDSNKRSRDDSEFALPALHVQFSFLEEKHLDAALSGRLAPELLIHLVPPTHAFFKEVADAATVALVTDGGDADAFRAVRPKKSEPDVVKRFMASIPGFSVFSVAWMNLATLMCHGLADKVQAALLNRAMVRYMEWIADCSVQHTWESIVRYHLRFAAPRFAAGGSDPAHWAGSGDPRLLTILVRKDSAGGGSGRGNRRQASKSSTGNASASGSSAKTDKFDPSAPCLRWNHGQCTSGKCSRPHVCSLCGAKHRLREGHKA